MKQGLTIYDCMSISTVNEGKGEKEGRRLKKRMEDQTEFVLVLDFKLSENELLTASRNHKTKATEMVTTS